MMYCNQQNYKKRRGGEESSQEIELTYEMRVRHRGHHARILREKKKGFVAMRRSRIGNGFVSRKINSQPWSAVFFCCPVFFMLASCTLVSLSLLVSFYYCVLRSLLSFFLVRISSI